MGKKKQAPKDSADPAINPKAGIKILSEQLEEGRTMLARPTIEESPYDVWVHATTEYITKAFGENSNNVGQFSSVGYLGFHTDSMDEAWYRNHRRRSLTTQLAYLEAMVKMLQKDIEFSSLSASEMATEVASERMNNTIFIVHGRDDGIKETVARFVEHLGLEVVILHEKPNKGRPVIEKFIDHAQDAGYAVVIMTPDDKGGLATDPPDKYRFRARQNVVFELGFFLARLGRGKVCALYSPEVESPSDYNGVGYVELDSKGAWKSKLAKEITAAGFKINLKALP